MSLLNRTQLVALDLANNAATFGGALNTINFGGLTSIQVIDLSENAFTGAIPASLVSRGTLTDLNLSQNGLTGQVPAFGSTPIPGLQALDLATNGMSGEILLVIAGLPAAMELTFCGNAGLLIGGGTVAPPPGPALDLYNFVNPKDPAWHTVCP